MKTGFAFQSCHDNVICYNGKEPSWEIPLAVIYFHGYLRTVTLNEAHISLKMAEAELFEQSLYDEEANGTCSKEMHSSKGSSRDKRVYESGGMEGFCHYEKFEEMPDMEGPIEATIHEEMFQASSVDDHKLDEVSTYLRPLEVIFGVKERFRDKLNQQGIHGSDLVDFNLGLMAVLNALDKGDTVEKFLQEAYVGCFQCLMCLHFDKELSKASQKLGSHLSNVLSVLGHVLTEQGSSVPDLPSEQQKYDESELQHLTERTNEYLRGKSELLRRNAELIKDFEVISEMDSALTHLRVEFEELKRNPHEVSPPVSAFTLFNEMEKTTDFSSSCWTK